MTHLKTWDEIIPWLKNLSSEELRAYYNQVCQDLFTKAYQPKVESFPEITFLSQLKALLRIKLQHPNKPFEEILNKLLTPNTNRETLHNLTGNILALLPQKPTR